MFSVLSNVLQKICKDRFLIPIYDLWLSKPFKVYKFFSIFILIYTKSAVIKVLVLRIVTIQWY